MNVIHIHPRRNQARPTILRPEQRLLMLHMDDLNMIRAALSQVDGEDQRDAHRAFNTLGEARGVLRHVGAGALALRPLHSLGGAG